MNESMKQLSVGFPGRLKSMRTPWTGYPIAAQVTSNSTAVNFIVQLLRKKRLYSLTKTVQSVSRTFW